MGTWTTIDHDVRRKYELTLNEYAVCDTIYILSHGRPCTLKQDEIGEPLGLTRETVCRIIRRLIEKKLIKKSKCGFVTTDIWNEEMVVTKGHSRSDEKSQQRVTKSHSESDEKSQSSIRATDSNNNNDKDIAAAPPSQKQKRSDEEKTAFAEIWEMFERVLGRNVMAASNKLTAKSIWEMIDKKNNGNGWREELKKMVTTFINQTKNPPKGMDYLKGCRPFPHVMNGERTWLRLTSIKCDDGMTAYERRELERMKREEERAATCS